MVQDEIKNPEISPLDDAKKTLEALNKAKAEAKAEADRLEKLKSDQLLSGTGGLRPEMPMAKPETDKEYRKRIEAEIRAGKYNDRG